MTQRRNKTSFKKGNIPWNKDIKGIHLSENSEWKKGNIPHNYKGGHQIESKWGRITYDIKTKKKTRDARLIYEKEYEKIPRGYIIWHKDKDKWNDNIDNLEAISRKELAYRNRWKSII